MKLTLIRTISNRSCTIGRLMYEGRQICYTQEGPIPLDRKKYIGQLLPPGTYKGVIVRGPMPFRGETIQATWGVLDRVDWFPSAGIYDHHGMGPKKGIILIGKESPDEFGLADADSAMAQLSHIYDHHRQRGDNQLILDIIQDEDAIEVHGYTDLQYADIKAENERIARQEKAQKEFDELGAAPLRPMATSPKGEGEITPN